MAIVFCILRIIIGIAIVAYGIFCFKQSVEGYGNPFAMVNMIAVPLGCLIFAAIVPPFRSFAVENLQILFIMIGSLIVCSGVLACFDNMEHFPGIVNSIGLIVVGAWASGVVPESVINPIVYGLANIISAFFVPFLIIMGIFVALKSIFW